MYERLGGHFFCMSGSGPDDPRQYPSLETIMAEPLWCVNIVDVIHVTDMDEAYGTYAADDE